MSGGTLAGAARRAVAASAVLAASACATPRLHSAAELSSVADRCALPPEDIVQDSDFRKVLFLFTAGASRPQVDCVHRWARRNHLHFAYLEAVVRER